MKRVLAFVVVASGALGGVGCQASDELAGKCIVTALGQKLCGADARAWCDATEDLRRGDAALGVKADTRSQDICDSL